MSTSQQVVDLRQRNPCMATAEIARRVGISRQGAWQILSSRRLRTRGWHPSKVLKWVCIGCGKGTYSKGGYCQKCRWILLVCDSCGKEFRRYASELVFDVGKRGYQRVFCNRLCCPGRPW